MYTMPQQIALYKWNPSEYLPKIECPVMAVFGTKDEQIEYSGSLKNMKVLLETSGNTNFTAQVLDGYNVTRTPWNRGKLLAQRSGNGSCAMDTAIA